MQALICNTDFLLDELQNKFYLHDANKEILHCMLRFSMDLCILTAHAYMLTCYSLSLVIVIGTYKDSLALSQNKEQEVQKKLKVVTHEKEQEYSKLDDDLNSKQKKLNLLVDQYKCLQQGTEIIL